MLYHSEDDDKPIRLEQPSGSSIGKSPSVNNSRLNDCESLQENIKVHEVLPLQRPRINDVNNTYDNNLQEECKVPENLCIKDLHEINREPKHSAKKLEKAKDEQPRRYLLESNISIVNPQNNDTENDITVGTQVHDDISRKRNRQDTDEKDGPCTSVSEPKKCKTQNYYLQLETFECKNGEGKDEVTEKQATKRIRIENEVNDKLHHKLHQENDENKNLSENLPDNNSESEKQSSENEEVEKKLFSKCFPENNGLNVMEILDILHKASKLLKKHYKFENRFLKFVLKNGTSNEMHKNKDMVKNKDPEKYLQENDSETPKPSRGKEKNKEEPEATLENFSRKSNMQSLHKDLEERGKMVSSLQIIRDQQNFGLQLATVGLEILERTTRTLRYILKKNLIDESATRTLKSMEYTDQSQSDKTSNSSNEIQGLKPNDGNAPEMDINLSSSMNYIVQKHNEKIKEIREEIVRMEINCDTTESINHLENECEDNRNKKEKLPQPSSSSASFSQPHSPYILPSHSISTILQLPNSLMSSTQPSQPSTRSLPQSSHPLDLSPMCRRDSPDLSKNIKTTQSSLHPSHSKPILSNSHFPTSLLQPSTSSAQHPQSSYPIAPFRQPPDLQIPYQHLQKPNYQDSLMSSQSQNFAESRSESSKMPMKSLKSHNLVSTHSASSNISKTSLKSQYPGSIQSEFSYSLKIASYIKKYEASSGSSNSSKRSFETQNFTENTRLGNQTTEFGTLSRICQNFLKHTTDFPNPSSTSKYPDATSTSNYPIPTTFSKRSDPTSISKRPDPPPNSKHPNPTPNSKHPNPIPNSKHPNTTPNSKHPNNTPNSKHPNPSPTCLGPTTSLISHRFPNLKPSVSQFHDSVPSFFENSNHISNYFEFPNPLLTNFGCSYPTQAYSGSPNPAQAYSGSPNPTQAYSRSHNPTQAYSRSHNPTQAYSRSHNPTQAYSRSHNPTQAYSGSQQRPVSFSRPSSPSVTSSSSKSHNHDKRNDQLDEGIRCEATSTIPIESKTVESCSKCGFVEEKIRSNSQGKSICKSCLVKEIVDRYTKLDHEKNIYTNKPINK